MYLLSHRLAPSIVNRFCDVPMLGNRSSDVPSILNRWRDVPTSESRVVTMAAFGSPPRHVRAANVLALNVLALNVLMTPPPQFCFRQRQLSWLLLQMAQRRFQLMSQPRKACR